MGLRGGGWREPKFADMTLASRRITVEEYLARERQAAFKSEYFQGKIYAMSGANESHNLIVANIVGELRSQFKGRPCRVLPSDMRVKVSPAGLYTYPDVLAWRGDARYEDEKKDTLLNPGLIVEVLSRRTESYDRGEKFAHYRQLESMTDYVLVSQVRFRVEHFSRLSEGRWLLTEHSEINEVLELVNLKCQLPLSEIYENVLLESPRLRARRRKPK